MPELAISARSLGKRYRLGRVESGFHALGRRVRRRASAGGMWALENLTFDVPAGQTLALVGRNGAGKSTLLKILARITEPTSGYVDVRGRVGALLEVGTGFHGDLTGRENIFLNGSIHGMSRSEVRRKLDAIIEFSGVSRHIDTPVKWYSSGMYVRLAFAVAAHLEPEILVVDEVLAVGDADFQRRCIGRMSDVAQEGRTVLFVSHNMQIVRSLCERTILLESGKIVADGLTDPVVRQYLTSLVPVESGRREWSFDAMPGNDDCRLAAVQVIGDKDEATSSFFSSETIRLVVELDVRTRDDGLVVVFDLAASDGSTVFRSYSADAGLKFGAQPGRRSVSCAIPSGLLNHGRYIVNMRVHAHGIDGIINEPGVLYFDVSPDHGENSSAYFHQRPGVIAPVLQWEEVASNGRTTVAALTSIKS